MKSEPYFMIYCIVLFENGIENKLMKEINQFIKKYWTDASILLISSNPYWKIEGEQAIVSELCN